MLDNIKHVHGVSLYTSVVSITRGAWMHKMHIPNKKTSLKRHYGHLESPWILMKPPRSSENHMKLLGLPWSSLWDSQKPFEISQKPHKMLLNPPETYWNAPETLSNTYESTWILLRSPKIPWDPLKSPKSSRPLRFLKTSMKSLETSLKHPETCYLYQQDF